MHHKKSNPNGTIKNSEKERIKNYGNDYELILLWIKLFCLGFYQNRSILIFFSQINSRLIN